LNKLWKVVQGFSVENAKGQGKSQAEIGYWGGFLNGRKRAVIGRPGKVQLNQVLVICYRILYTIKTASPERVALLGLLGRNVNTRKIDYGLPWWGFVQELEACEVSGHLIYPSSL